MYNKGRTGVARFDGQRKEYSSGREQQWRTPRGAELSRRPGRGPSFYQLESYNEPQFDHVSSSPSVRHATARACVGASDE
ncbi:hypothetical protein EVAR_80401_1 [Eumeta japonica]|uniref:Uncharacterized protein n=1 Tax=Eumeta variegata TaxID=151549 RepID=A0A4C1VG50_EUMVA|nr:hypothetical protein EVAR_80401_1 [Eumeta japonica]